MWLHRELNEYSKKLVEIDNHQKIVDESALSKDKNEKSLESLTNEISKSEKEIKDLPKIKLESDLTEQQLEEQININRKSQSKKEKNKAVLKKKLENIDKLLKEGKCSLCGQKIYDKGMFDSELKKTKDGIEKLSDEIKF